MIDIFSPDMSIDEEGDDSIGELPNGIYLCGFMVLLKGKKTLHISKDNH